VAQYASAPKTKEGYQNAWIAYAVRRRQLQVIKRAARDLARIRVAHRPGLIQDASRMGDHPGLGSVGAALGVNPAGGQVRPGISVSVVPAGIGVALRAQALKGQIGRRGGAHPSRRTWRTVGA